MNIFCVGLRRSGNTICRDVLSSDKRFDCYSEPLRKGSGKLTPHLKKLQNVRKSFLDSIGNTDSHTVCAFGAPTSQKQEVLEKLPQLHQQYIEFLTKQSEHTLIKFVRVAFTIEQLPFTKDTKLVHVIRDPRRFAASHIYGKNYGRKLNFFGHPKAKMWSQEQFINIIIDNNPKYLKYKNAPTYEKMLLMWKIANEKIEKDGKARFGDNYIKLKHENLCKNPTKTLHKLYDFLKLDCPASVLQWADNLRKPRPIKFKAHSNWARAYKDINITY